jgi:predicted lysophospholipase L1 biosynthesis ABC-type transport system permease subunit
LVVDNYATGSIVGIADIPFRALARGLPPLVLTFDAARERPQTAAAGGRLFFSIRATLPRGLVKPIQARLDALFPDAALKRVTLGTTLLDAEIGKARVAQRFFAMSGLIAVIVALFSVFGLSRYLFESKRRELAVRAMLGASTVRLCAGLFRSIVPPFIGGSLAGTFVAIGFGTMTSSVAFTGASTSSLEIAYCAAVAIGLLSLGLVAAIGLILRRIETDRPLAALRMN